MRMAETHPELHNLMVNKILRHRNDIKGLWIKKNFLTY